MSRSNVLVYVLVNNTKEEAEKERFESWHIAHFFQVIHLSFMAATQKDYLLL
jgi:hypothetical protein